MRALCLVALIGATLSGCASAHRAWTNELDGCVAPCDECGPKPHKGWHFNSKAFRFGGSKSCSCGGCDMGCGDCGSCSPCMTDCGSCSGGCSSCGQGGVVFDGTSMPMNSSCQTCQQNGMSIPATPGSEFSTPGQPANPTPNTPPATPQPAPGEPAPEPEAARMMQPMQMQPVQMQTIQAQPLQMQTIQMQPAQMQPMQMQPLQVVPQQVSQPQVQTQRAKPAVIGRHQEWMQTTPMVPNQNAPGMQTQYQAQPAAGNAVQPVLWVPAQQQAQPQAKAVAQPQVQQQVIYQQAPLQTTSAAPLLVPAR